MLFASDLAIDRTSGQVQRGHQTLNLTPIEFRLLVYLAQRPGQALMRVQILDAVWGYVADVDSERTITVHIEGALQELAEIHYWLELLIASEIMKAERVQSLLEETAELIAMFVTMAKNVKTRSKRT